MRQYLIIAERNDVTFFYLQEAKTNAKARWSFIDYAEKQNLGAFKNVTAIILPVGRQTAFLTSILQKNLRGGEEETYTFDNSEHPISCSCWLCEKGRS